MNYRQWLKALGVAACAASTAAPVSAHVAAGPIDCTLLLATTLEGATISVAQLNAATSAMPQHCEVVGAIDERTGIDGQKYAIRFRLRLPTDWNQRFFYQGGGGTDGNIGNADAPQLSEGYAVVSTDSGHDNAVNNTPLAGSFQFGFDPQARGDYGYNGPVRVAVAAKAISTRFYGKAPRYSYFAGCSEGGREGLMLSQRYPGLFDGIVSGNPGMDLPGISCMVIRRVRFGKRRLPILQPAYAAVTAAKPGQPCWCTA